MNNFPIDMVRRTAINLASYKGPFAMTNLLNCTLGLIILPYEKRFYNNTQNSPWNTNKADFSHWLSYQYIFFNPIQGVDRRNGRITFFDENLGYLLRKIRHGLAHQNIEPENRDHQVVGVTITNYYNTNKDRSSIQNLTVFPNTHVRENQDGKIEIKDLEIKFSQEQLTEFALFVASEHLKDCLEINKEYVIDPSLPGNKNKGRHCSLVNFQQSQSSKRTVAKIKYLDTNKVGRTDIELWQLR